MCTCDNTDELKKNHTKEKKPVTTDHIYMIPCI